MMCSRFLKHTGPGERHRFMDFIDGQFNMLRAAYERMLQGALNYLPVVGVFAAIILASNYFLFAGSKSELAPQEDQGFMLAMLTAAPDAISAADAALCKAVSRDRYRLSRRSEHLFQVEGFNGLNSGFAGMVLKPWDERTRTTRCSCSRRFRTSSARSRAHGQWRSSLRLCPGPDTGLPVQFVIGTTESFDRLNEVSQTFMDKARASGMFMFVDTDLKIDKPQTVVEFDRDKAAQLGLTMADVGGSLASMLGGGYVNYFSLSGRSYKVIPQVKQSDRLTADQLNELLHQDRNGQCDTGFHHSAPEEHRGARVHQPLPAAQQRHHLGGPHPRHLPGSGPGFSQDHSQRTYCPRVTASITAASRASMCRSRARLLFTFVFALIIIFLALAALFESFRDPIIVLVSVPMSICGALIFISLGIGGASLNIYTEVGLVTLIGLISKHGILIVQFANDLQRQGRSKREAIEQASAVRLRPILMTTAAMVLGIMPWYSHPAQAQRDATIWAW